MTLSQRHFTSGVYIHVKPVTREIYYIGFTSNIDGKRPFSNDRRNPHWKNTYNKYGKEVVLFSSGIKKDMLELEKELISVIGIDNLTNMTMGGEGSVGYKHSEETKEKMSKNRKGISTGPLSEDIKEKISIANTGRTPWNKGVPLSLEAKKKLSISLKGKEPWNKGVPCLDHVKKAVSSANKGIKRSKEFKENLRKIKTGTKLPGQTRPKSFVEVSQYTKEGILVKTFNSIKEAVSHTNITRTGILNNLNNRSKSSGGFVWKYTNI